MPVACPHCQSPVEPADPDAQEILCPACGSSFRLERDSTADWASSRGPRTLGNFELIEAIGSGAFGTVYKARDPRLDRTVAIKVPRSGHLADRADLDRFLREARSVARLRHPAIVPVHDVGEHEGVPYLISDFVQGLTLTDLLSARRLPPREAAELVAAVADALHYAHEHGVVHRDVKPSNILLDDAGHPHLMDFGLAKRDAGDVTMTTDGQVLGTPAYMSPEQARGEGHRVDGRSDVYSLGVVLYQMLTSELPFRGTPRMLLHQVLHDEPRRPRSFNDRIPRDLETICLKAMAKEPSRRYATAAELGADLRRFLAGEPIQARPVGAAERAWRWARRHPTAAALAAVSFVAGVALIAAGFFFAYNGRLRAANRTVDQQRAIAEGARGQAQQALELANRYLYLLRVNQAGLAWRENQADRAAALLDGCPPEQRGWEWHYLDRQRHASSLILRGPGVKYFFGVAFSPDGRYVAAGGDDNTVRIWDTDTGRESRVLRGHTGEVWGVAFSPDGRRIASGGADATVRVWDADTGQETLALPVRPGHLVNAVAFHPDGRRIVSKGVDVTTRVWDLATGREVFTPWGHERGTGRFALSPDGRRIALADWDGDGPVRVADAETGKEVVTLRGHKQWLRALGFSPDGRRIVTAGYDQTLRVWDVSSGRETLTLWGHAGLVWSVAFAPDGRHLASAGEDGTVRIWDTMTAEKAHRLRGHAALVVPVAFSPDGRRIVSAGDRTVRIWDADTGQEMLVFREHRASRSGAHQEARDNGQTPLIFWEYGGYVYGAAFSPDGHRIVSGGYDGAVRVWDAGTGRETLVLRGDGGTVFAVAISPDGRRIACAGKDGTLRVWDATTGQDALILRGHKGPVWDVEFSPDSRQIVSGGEDETLRVWDAASGRELRTLSGHHDRVCAASFSPDGSLIASSSHDNTVRLWDAATGRETHTLRGHIGWLSGVAFSPDGQRLASTGEEDGTVRIWDVTTGQETLVIPGMGPAERVAFSPDGRRLVSADGDAVAIWDATPVSPRWEEESRTLADRRWPVWQRQEVPRCLRSEEWFAAAWHLDRLIASQPPDAGLFCDRAVARAHLGRWEEAAADFARSEALPDAPVRAGSAESLLRWDRGDFTGSRCAVARLLDRFEATSDPLTVDQVVRACVRSPGLTPHLPRVLRLARRSAEERPGDPDALANLGAALVRAGQCDEAVSRLNEAVNYRDAPGADARDAWSDWLFLALAYQKLARPDEARRALAKADNGDQRWQWRPPLPWEAQLELTLLRREVEALILYDPIFPADPFAR